MRLDVAFEEEVLSKAMRDIAFLKRAARVLDEHHFSTRQHSWVWKSIRHFWDTYREPATVKLILSKARADFPDEEKRAPYLELSRRLFKLTPTTSGAALDELSVFVRTVNAQLTVEKVLADLEKGRVEEVYAQFRAASQKDLRAREYTQIKWIEEFKQRQEERKHRREHPEEYTSIPTGLKRLDKILGGGVQIGELALCLATTGRGKSILLNNIAYNGVLAGYPTAIFGFEMPARQIAMRQDARWLQIPYNKFKDYNFSPSELRYIQMRLKKMRKRFKGMMRIFSMPVRSADINTVRAALDDARLEDGFVPKLVILDSPDHLNPTHKGESTRIDQSNVYWETKGFAESDGYAVWASTHAGKEFVERTATAESAAESYDKARIADLILTLNEPRKATRATRVVEGDEDDDETEEDSGPKTTGRYMEGFLAKYRDGASKMTIPLDAQLDKMLICEAGLEEEK